MERSKINMFKIDKLVKEREINKKEKRSIYKVIEKNHNK
jgi:hypothetical protein